MGRCTLRSWILVLAVVAAAWICAGDAAARGNNQPSEEALIEAKVHFQAGKMYYDKEKYRQAITEFEEGYDLVKKPAFLVNIAQSYRKLGNNGKAREYYRRYLDEDPGSPQRTQVEKIIGEIEAEMGQSGGGEEDTAAAAAAAVGVAPAGAPSSRPAGAPAAVPAAAPQPEEPEPVAVATEDPGVRRPPRQPKPFYAKAWFWTLMGLVVVGGAAGAYFATRQPDYVTEGTLGTIDARRKM